MRKYILISIIAFTLYSCEDFLDAVAEVDGATEEVVFNDFQSARGYFDNVFNIVDDYHVYQNQGMNVHFITAEMSDEGANCRKGLSNMGSFHNRGLWDTQDGHAEYGWADGNVNGVQGNVIPKSFYGIRICNRILEEIPHLGHLTDNQKNQLIGQAYFFRAWFYFEVIRRIGGFVVMDRRFYSNDSGDMERMTYAESTEWMIRESLDKAIEILPDRWEASQTGRPTKSSAYALRSMAQLYAASPLMQNGTDRIDVYTEYHPERVVLAAEYAKECLDYLERNAAVYDQRMMPGSEYTNIFYYPSSQYMSREMLWYKNNYGRTRDQDIATYWQTWRMSGRTNVQGAGNFNPSLNTINKFETENGYPCELTASGWVSDDPGFDANEPFKGRDPRLYHFVVLPGEEFGDLGSVQITDAELASLGLTAADVPDRSTFYLCSWENGRETDVTATSGNAGRGDVIARFLIKKFHWPACVRGNQVASNYSDNTYSTSFIRTTQVWLDYAEAMNEAYGPNGKPAGYEWSAVEAINKVRERVSMPGVLDQFTTSKELFRERIRNERAVELLCEHQRWFDIRRWMIAEELFDDPAPIKRARVTIKEGHNSIKISSFPPGNTRSERQQAKYGASFNYVLEPIIEEIRIFERKHYWYPMRRDEVDRYPAFKQNPGW